MGKINRCIDCRWCRSAVAYESAYDYICLKDNHSLHDADLWAKACERFTPRPVPAFERP